MVEHLPKLAHGSDLDLKNWERKELSKGKPGKRVRAEMK